MSKSRAVAHDEPGMARKCAEFSASRGEVHAVACFVVVPLLFVAFCKGVTFFVLVLNSRQGALLVGLGQVSRLPNLLVLVSVLQAVSKMMEPGARRLGDTPRCVICNKLAAIYHQLCGLDINCDCVIYQALREKGWAKLLEIVPEGPDRDARLVAYGHTLVDSGLIAVAVSAAMQERYAPTAGVEGAAEGGAGSLPKLDRRGNPRLRQSLPPPPGVRKSTRGGKGGKSASASPQRRFKTARGHLYPIEVLVGRRVWRCEPDKSQHQGRPSKTTGNLYGSSTAYLDRLRGISRLLAFKVLHVSCSFKIVLYPTCEYSDYWPNSPWAFWLPTWWAWCGEPLQLYAMSKMFSKVIQ
jgi:hypothetical protein